MANNVVNFKRGTAAQYNAATKDADTLYFVTSSGGSPSVEMGELFLGSVRIGVGIGTSADPSTNKTYYGLKNYVDSSFVSAVAEGNANGKIAVTKNGTTTQVSVHGLGSAAYTNASAYATAAQGETADSAIQSIVSGSNGVDVGLVGGREYYVGLRLASQESLGTETGFVAIRDDGPEDDLYIDLNAAGIYEGSLTPTNKLLTKSVASSLYGLKASANTWTGNNTFSGAFSANDGASISADSGDVIFSVSPGGIELNSRYGVNIYASERGYISASEPIRYDSGVTPSDSQDLTTKSYVDSLISGLGTAVSFVGVSTSNPASTTGATFSGHTTWKKGEVVLYGNKEFINVTGSNASTTTPNPNWKELGDEGSYALKTVTVTGTGYLTGGGDLTANRTIDINSATKTKIDGAVQDVSDGTAGSITTTRSGANVLIALNINNDGSCISLSDTNAGLHAVLNGSYVDGAPTTSNKLLTKSAADGYYGKLSGNNAWTGNNTFDAFSEFIIYDSTSQDLTLFSVNSSGVELDSPTGYISIGPNFGSTMRYANTISISNDYDLVHKLYVDTQVTTALTWASI